MKGVPQSGVEAAQLSEAAENPENQGGMPIPDLTKTLGSHPLFPCLSCLYFYCIHLFATVHIEFN